MIPSKAQFDVDVGLDAALAFAEMSGDWNPLHTDAAHAATTSYGQPVLHGAYSAGLVSRMAGMHLPGKDCLLHGLNLRFLAPIIPPVSLRVSGHLTGTGKAEVTIADRETGRRYVAASYEFGHHQYGQKSAVSPVKAENSTSKEKEPDRQARTIVTGARGALGGALIHHLGDYAIGLSRKGGDNFLLVPDLENWDGSELEGSISGIIHCAWPQMDNEALLHLPDTTTAIETHLAAPLRQILALGRVLAERGEPDAPLIIVGSTAALSGRHAWQSPLYSLAKSLVPTLARILAFELAASRHRCMGVVFDMLDGGMNKGLSPANKLANADRSPAGRLATPEEAAAQIKWMLENKSFLASGSTLILDGSALP